MSEGAQSTLCLMRAYGARISVNNENAMEDISITYYENAFN